MTERLTIREACRQRRPLNGSDAQALEGALAQVERELHNALALAKVLAHSYTHNSNPPVDMVAEALKYDATSRPPRKDPR